jgi:hypothetical protein
MSFSSIEGLKRIASSFFLGIFFIQSTLVAPLQVFAADVTPPVLVLV